MMRSWFSRSHTLNAGVISSCSITLTWSRVSPDCSNHAEAQAAMAQLRKIDPAMRVSKVVAVSSTW
jgi:hypothetical protein